MKITIKEIEMWIDNDEGLFLWWQRSRKSKRNFIKENHEELIQIIKNALAPKKLK